MHVLHLVDTLALGGKESMLVDIANCAVTRGVTVSVCQTRSLGVLSSRLAGEIELLTLNRKRRFGVSAPKLLANWTAARSVDVIHVHGRSSLQFLLYAKILRRINCRIVFHDHFGVDVDTDVPIWFRLCARFIDKYVGVSASQIPWASRAGIDPAKITQITNSVDFGRFAEQSDKNIRDELPVCDDVLLGIVVCGLRSEKGVDVLLRALALVEYQKYQMVVVGGEAETGYLEKCERLAEDLNVTDKVVFAGKRLDIANYLSSFEFAVVPSLSESGPLVVIEFLAHGLPLIATRTGAVSAVADNCGVGLFVDPGDAKRLASAMNHLFQLDAGARKAIGRAGIDVANKEFDLNMRIDQWISVYTQVLEAS